MILKKKQPDKPIKAKTDTSPKMSSDEFNPMMMALLQVHPEEPKKKKSNLN